MSRSELFIYLCLYWSSVPKASKASKWACEATQLPAGTRFKNVRGPLEKASIYNKRMFISQQNTKFTRILGLSLSAFEKVLFLVPKYGLYFYKGNPKNIYRVKYAQRTAQHYNLNSTAI